MSQDRPTNMIMTTASDDYVEGRSARKRRAVIEAATKLFLQNGYLGTNMDEVANVARVSKQTVYKQFSNKESLFIEIVTSLANAASNAVHNAVPRFVDGADLTEYLCDYAYRQLRVVLTPQLMQLRRMVIGEVGRFPELGTNLYESGPKRAMAAFAATLSNLAKQGLLSIEDPANAASHFNWLIMSAPVNQVMLLGDRAIPNGAQLRRHAEQGVRVFLAAYGTKGLLSLKRGRTRHPRS
jgi:TetR/AcrR family transcriptional regulator, mexJK operon transcriptional repressor